jgi:hypothetical protein
MEADNAWRNHAEIRKMVPIRPKPVEINWQAFQVWRWPRNVH